MKIVDKRLGFPRNVDSFEFIRNTESKIISHLSISDTWVELAIEFLLFLKGCGFIITRKHFENTIDEFDANGAFYE